MNSKIALLAISVAALSSCSSAYRTGQTPDDVYFSPTRTYAARGQVKQEEVKKPVDYYEDREIRMSILSPRWRSFDYDYYNYTPYSYGFNYGYYYNPYYCPYPVYNTVIIQTINPFNSTPRMTNLASYNNGYNNTNTNYIKTSPTKPVRSYRARAVNYSAFGYGTDYYSPSGGNGSSSRSYSPSSSGGGSSSGSSGSGGISRPSRNGN